MGHKFIKNLPKIFYFSTHFIIIVFWMKKIYKNTKEILQQPIFYKKSMFSSIHNFLLKIDVFVAFLIFYGYVK